MSSGATTKRPSKTAAKVEPAPEPKLIRAPRNLRVLYIGNFEPPHSTENHVARALEHNGHEVHREQENHPTAWSTLSTVDGWPFIPDLILWTRTGWDYPAPSATKDHQHEMLEAARTLGVPTVGYHLDIWWGLKRERQIHEEPFFWCDLMVTADGGHDEQWAARRIDHVWFPPAISLGEADIGMFRDEFHSKIAFVGSWQGHYHEESQHRFELVRWLRRNFRRDCEFWPKPGQHAIRGKDLQDLYASVDVVVGDSCFVGTGLTNYWSDRIPETLGRGGLLLHPYVSGMEEQFPFGTLNVWPAGDWEHLGREIETMLRLYPEVRREIAARGRRHVLEHHTYERRMEQLVTLLDERGML